jgi:inosine-uridine nucleoside N-ribohydrolase
MSSSSPSPQEAAKAIIEELKSSENQPRENTIILGADVGTDIDDDSLICAYTMLHKLGVIDLQLIVTNREHNMQRAMATKFILKSMGVSEIPVAYGTDDPIGEVPYHAYNPDDTIIDGETAVYEVLTRLKEKEERCNIVVVSSSLDLSRLIKSHPNLVRQTVSSISFQGGWEEDLDGWQCNTLVPNMKVINNQWDPEATAHVHEWLRQEIIPTFTATRCSANKATVNPCLIEELSNQENVVAQYIYDAWRRQEKKYYDRADHSVAAERFRPHQGKGWYTNRVPRWIEANGKALPGSFEEIEPYLDMVLYDLIAGLINPLRKYDFFPMLFQPHQQTLRVRKTDVHHYLIGQSAAEPNINADLLSAFMGQLLQEAFTM